MAFEAALVVMAAGMGSRFGGLKQTEPVGPHGEAILDYSVYDAKRAGFTKVVVVIKHEIEDDFRRIVGTRIERQLPVEYVFQETDALPDGFSCPAGRKKPWGTGQAVLCCLDAVDVPFAVINADDFYGADAFRKVYEGLKRKDEYCMAGFRLGNTVSENGTVSRGICETENGFLSGITECTKIDAQCRYEAEDGSWIPLSPETVVSMNFWGMQPDAFSYFEKDFRTFLSEHGGDVKAEFYLPSVIDGLIRSGEKKVRVHVAEDRWYGVTYRQDKVTVVRAIREMTEQGKYDGLQPL